MSAITSLSRPDLRLVRDAFPVLNQNVNGYPLVYLDNAATTQKPKAVIHALSEYYQMYNANIHRGVHTLAEKATHAFEETREAVRNFIGADVVEEIIFVRGVTEAINLVARCYDPFVKEGDEIIISALEHHSNIVPWQWLCERKKARLRVIPINDDGEILLDEFYQLLSDRTRVVALNHASNSLGSINPVKEIIAAAHDVGAVALIDGAQSGAHVEIDVKEIDCDFYCLSAHKMYGPTGAGILYGKKELLERMPPYQGGGEMIREVTFQKTTYNDLPYKFEAGTPSIADVIALREAIAFITAVGKDNIRNHELDLLEYATERIAAMADVTIIGNARSKVGILSFVVDGLHPFDIGQMLDARGIAVRTGHHCTQPLMQRFGINGTVRASFAVYNNKHDVDQLVDTLNVIIPFLKM